MTPKEAADIIDINGHLWPTVPTRTGMLDDQARIWATVLDDITYSEAEIVIIEHSRTGAPFPLVPGVIAERALTMREKANGTYAPDVDQALAEVSAAIRHGGINLLDPRRTVGGVPAVHEWSHPAVAAAVRAIGWRDLCTSDRPDVIRAQFVKAYEAARTRIVAEQRRAPQTRQALSLIQGTPVPALPTGEPHGSKPQPSSGDRARRPRAV